MKALNPYEVLGVPEGASADQIYTAYKQKMAYYATADGDFSKESEQLNQAFDALMYGGNAAVSSDAGESVKYGDVRAKIRERRLEDAETILDGIPISVRDGEWYYLKGTIFKMRGWLEDATDCFKKAVQLSPGNTEYAEAYRSINQKRNGSFRDDWREQNGQSSGCLSSACKLCAALACCDCLCSCLR